MSMNDRCPIWGTPAELVRDPLRNGGMEYVNSLRTGGEYSISGRASMRLNDVDKALKIKLTNWIVEQNRFNLIPIVDQARIEQVKSSPPLSVFDRADRLLLYLNRKSDLIGSVIKFYELDNKKTRTTEYELLAWTGSQDISEVITLAEYSHQEKWIEHRVTVRRAIEPNNIHEIMLRPLGYARLAELDGANPDSPQGFVAMWFDDSQNEASKAIQNAISDAGYKPQQINQKEHINKICDEIIAEIRRSRFVVADFTSEPDNPRGGVYYEAGFAQGLNIPVIWTCREDLIGQVHFDTNHYNHITWKNEADLYEKLKKRIEAVIGDGPSKNKKKTG